MLLENHHFTQTVQLLRNKIIFVVGLVLIHSAGTSRISPKLFIEHRVSLKFPGVVGDEVG